MIIFINKNVIDLCSTSSKWCIILTAVSSTCNHYITCHKNICIRLVTKTWLKGVCFNVNRTVFIAFIFHCCLVVHNISFFAANLDWPLLELFNRFMIFRVFIPYTLFLQIVCSRTNCETNFCELNLQKTCDLWDLFLRIRQKAWNLQDYFLRIKDKFKKIKTSFYSLLIIFII